MKHPIVIIGAGFTGMIALKTCKEQGFDAICFEKTDNVGGLWRFREGNYDGVASVSRKTVLNTSKEMCAVSDFPPPADYPNFMHQSKNLQYLENYVNHFQLLEYVRCEHEVLKVSKANDFEKTGEWTVLVRNKQGDETVTRASAVMVCIGHHVYPNIPTFTGQSKFAGNIIHSHSYKDSSLLNLKGKNALVVGMGNSGADIATELSFMSDCNQVYLSTRRGSWILNRLGANGLPYDFALTRYNALIHKYFPKYYNDMVEKSLNFYYNHALYNFKPQHRFDAQHPTITDTLGSRIMCGAVIVKGDISHFTEKGVIFKCELDKEYEVDFVILSTGYEYKLPIVDENDVSIRNNQVELYKRILPPNTTNHHTLGIIGMIQPNAPIIPVAELQIRWFLQILKGQIKLPGHEKQLAEIKQYVAMNRARYVNSKRHTIEVDFIQYTDMLAGDLKCKPNLFKLFFTDHKLFRSLMFGPFVSYQFRLNGPNPWPGARNAILTVYDRMRAPFNTRADHQIQSVTCNNRFSAYSWFFKVLTIFVCIGAIYVNRSKIQLLWNV